MNKHALLSMILLCALFAPLQAHATKTVSSPSIKQGDLELKWKNGLAHDNEDKSQDGAWEQKIGVSYGFTGRIFVELEGKAERDGDADHTEFSALEMEGRYAFTKEGDYWLGSALKGVYKYNTSGNPDKLEAVLLLGKKTGVFSHRANIGLEREVGQGAGHDTDFGFSWSSRYSYISGFQPGFELYSDFGSLSDDTDFEDQDHQLGSVRYGAIGDHFGYEAGYLFGLSETAPDGETKLIFKYGMEF